MSKEYIRTPLIDKKIKEAEKRINQSFYDYCSENKDEVSMRGISLTFGISEPIVRKELDKIELRSYIVNKSKSRIRKRLY